MKNVIVILLLILLIPTIVQADGPMNYLYLHVLTDTIQCAKVSTYDRVIESYELNQKLAKGEIVRLVDRLQGNQQVTTKLDGTGYYIFDRKELGNNSIGVTYDNHQLELVKQLSAQDHVVSLFLDPPHNQNFDNRLAAVERIYPYINSIETDSVMILCGSIIKNSEKDLALYTIQRDKVKKMIDYIYQSYVESKSAEELYPLLLEIVRDDDNPKQVKREFIQRIVSGLYFDSSSLITTDEIFETLLKTMNELANFTVSGFENYEKIDQNILSSISYTYDQGKLQDIQFIDFINKVIEIDKNPAVTLRALSYLTSFQLRSGKLEEAFETICTSLDKFKKPILWTSYKTPAYLNASASLIYLDYLMMNESDPGVILSAINIINEKATNFPEFQNYLLYRKALVLELSSHPQLKVIESYEKINFEPVNVYQFAVYSEQNLYIYFRQMKDQILKPMQEFEGYSLKVEGEYEAKKFLLTKETITLNLPVGSEIELLQKTPYILKEMKIYKGQNWVKAKTEDEIYWILMD